MKTFKIFIIVILINAGFCNAQKRKVDKFIGNFKEKGLLAIPQNETLVVLYECSNGGVNYYSYQNLKLKKSNENNSLSCSKNLNYCLKIKETEVNSYYNFHIVSGSSFKGHFELLGETKKDKFRFFNFFFTKTSI